MKGLIIILLTVTAFNVLGQNKSLRGRYSREIFMYEYALSLQDSGRYIVTEISDLQSITITGTWTIHEDVITLTPRKGWREQAPEMKRTEIQGQLLKVSFLKVDDNNTFTEMTLLTSAAGVKTEVRGNTLRKEISGAR